MLIREAKETDIAKLLVLMKGLARFERYIDVFAVTENELLEQGFKRSPPDFYCLVAEEAVRKGCGAIKWQVAPWNKDGIRFYEQLGAKANRDWVDFGLSAEAMRELASS